MRISNNNQAAELVRKRLTFQGNNIYARTNFPNEACATQRYVVYSWGDHWPLVICEEHGDKVAWFFNSDKYSQSTSRHLKKCMPNGIAMTPMTTKAMQVIKNKGIVGWICSEERA